MAASRRVVIEFLGKDKTLGSTTDSIGGKTSKLSGRLKKFGVVAAAGFGLAGLAAGKFALDTVKSASDMNETLNKSNTIFGKQGPAIEEWAQGAARSAGLSKQAAIEAAAGFGDMFSQIGFAGKEAAKMSKSTVQMAADLGSFNNLPTGDVAERLSAAFRGEYDSLQTLIPNINAARVEQQAMAMTGKKNAKELTAQEKAAAVLAIVHKDGARASGDFAKTSNGLANQQKILAAEFENTKASIGQKLLPVALKLSTWVLNTGVPMFSKLVGGIQAVTDILFKGDFTRRFRQIFGAGEDSKAVDTLFRIRETILSLVAAFKAKLPEIKRTFASVFADVKAIVISAVSIIRSLWAAFGDTIMSYTKSTFTNILTILRGAFTIIRGIFKTVAALLHGDWKGVWDGIKIILRGAVTVIKGLVSQMWNLIKAVFRASGVVLRAIFGQIWSGMKSLAKAGINGILAAIKSVPVRIRAYAGMWKSAGAALIRGFVSGMKNAAGIISGIAGNVWSSIKGLLNRAIDKINSHLRIHIGLPGKDINFSANIPHLAKGGIVKASKGGTLALLGEAGADEMVTPLSGAHAPKALASQQPIVVQLVVDGKTLAQSLVKFQRDTGRPIFA